MTQPNFGTGPRERWERLADEVALQVPVAEIDGVWVFQPLRNGPQEAGTAIISRVSGDRRRIYTARYVATVKGKQRGLWQSTIDEVGSGPIEALDRLLADVEKRVDEGAPSAVPVVEWFPERSEVEAEEAVEAVGGPERTEVGAEGAEGAVESVRTVTGPSTMPPTAPTAITDPNAAT